MINEMLLSNKPGSAQGKAYTANDCPSVLDRNVLRGWHSYVGAVSVISRSEFIRSISNASFTSGGTSRENT